MAVSLSAEVVLTQSLKQHCDIYMYIVWRIDGQRSIRNHSRFTIHWSSLIACILYFLFSQLEQL